MTDKDITSAIDQAITALQSARKLLVTSAKVGTASKVKPTAAESAPTKTAGKRTMSPEGRERIAEAQRKRWAASKKAAKKAARLSAK